MVGPPFWASWPKKLSIGDDKRAYWGDSVDNRFRDERLRLGLSVEEAAAGMGVPPRVLEGWETGRDEPRGSGLVAMSSLYGCSPDYLIGLADGRQVGLVVE